MKSVLLWGSIAFIWQTLLGIILPSILIPRIGEGAFGQLSFFMLLLNPLMWLDFTGNINSGLIAKIPTYQVGQAWGEIKRKYAATWIWWVIIWLMLAYAASYFQLTFFTPGQLIFLLVVPFLAHLLYEPILSYYQQQLYHRVYQYQILLSAYWLIFLWIGIQFFPISQVLIGIVLFFVPPLLIYRLTTFLLKSHQASCIKITPTRIEWKKNGLLASLRYQRLFVTQSALGLAVLLVDRLLIGNNLGWDYVTYYFVLLGLLFKFPSFLAVFNRPLISQVARWNQEKKYAQIKQAWVLTIQGTLLIGFMIFLPSLIYLEVLVTFWMNAEFAAKSIQIIRILYYLFPLVVLMMVAQSFLIALQWDKSANWISILSVLFHWLGTYIGISLFQHRGIALGFLSEGIATLVMICIVNRRLQLAPNEIFTFKKMLLLSVGIILFGWAIYQLSINKNLWSYIIALLFQLIVGLLLLQKIRKKQSSLGI